MQKRMHPLLALNNEKTVCPIFFVYFSAVKILLTIVKTLFNYPDFCSWWVTYNCLIIIVVPINKAESMEGPLLKDVTKESYYLKLNVRITRMREHRSIDSTELYGLNSVMVDFKVNVATLTHIQFWSLVNRAPEWKE